MRKADQSVSGLGWLTCHHYLTICANYFVLIEGFRRIISHVHTPEDYSGV